MARVAYTLTLQPFTAHGKGLRPLQLDHARGVDVEQLDQGGADLAEIRIIALGVGVFDSKNQFAAVMMNEEPVK